MSSKLTGPKFGQRKEEVKERPRTEAEVVARSAESIGQGKVKTGRPAAPEPMKNIGISLPVRLIEALDSLAAERCGRNRSFALVEILEGRLKLPDR